MSDRKIKILFLLDSLYGIGGTEKHLFDVATRLDKNRFQCIVCPIRFEQEYVDDFRAAGIRVILIPFERVYGYAAMKQAARLYHILKEEQVDVFQSFNIDSDIYGGIIAKCAGVPVIISGRRDLGTYRRKHHLLAGRITNRFVTRFVAVCDAVGQLVAETEDISPSRISTVHNGIDPDVAARVDERQVKSLKEKYHISEQSFVIGNVSHLRPEKGHSTFFEAILKIKAVISGLKVLVVGDGDLKPKFEKYVKDYGLSEIVIFSGYVDNVLEHVALMDICCLTPVSNEGFSNALLEQMTMGKAIIATDVGGNREAVIDGESGIIVPPLNVEALAEAMIRLYKNPPLRNEMGRAAKARVMEHFGIDKMISRMEQLYSKMLIDGHERSSEQLHVKQQSAIKISNII
jgi:glycosyltransferase involved in cell wall biosynthesis